MKARTGLYIELIGLTHFATASASVFYIYTEVKWSFIRSIDSHTLKTAPLKMHVFMFIHDVCCCFHAEQGWNIPLLSLFLTLFCFPLFALLFFSSRKRRFLSNCNDAKGYSCQNNIEHWRTHGNHVEPNSVQSSLPWSKLHYQQWRASWMQGNTYVDLVKSQPPPVCGEEL